MNKLLLMLLITQCLLGQDKFTFSNYQPVPKSITFYGETFHPISMKIEKRDTTTYKARNAQELDISPVLNDTAVIFLYPTSQYFALNFNDIEHYYEVADIRQWKGDSVIIYRIQIRRNATKNNPHPYIQKWKVSNE